MAAIRFTERTYTTASEPTTEVWGVEGFGEGMVFFELHMRNLRESGYTEVINKSSEREMLIRNPENDNVKVIGFEYIAA